jgi:hypothetical protein
MAATLVQWLPLGLWPDMDLKWPLHFVQWLPLVLWPDVDLKRPLPFLPWLPEEP